MKLKIEKSQYDAIQAELDKVNGKAVQFTIRFASDVISYAASIEKMLEESGLPKGERRGVTVTITPEGPSAKAYKYKAKSTTIKLERGAKEWFLTSVVEDEVWPAASARRAVVISESQRDTIQRKAVEKYTVAKAKVDEAIAA